VGVLHSRGHDEAEAGDRRQSAADDHRELTALRATEVDGHGELDHAGHGRPRAERDQRGAGVGAEARCADRDDREDADGGVDAKHARGRIGAERPRDRGDDIDRRVGRQQGGGRDRHIGARARHLVADDDHERRRPHESEHGAHDRDPPRRIPRSRGVGRYRDSGRES
jgi:hypothetical protein